MERNLSIIPYGIDISRKLIKLVKERLSDLVDNFYVANSWDWNPPVRFDYIRTELVYGPEHLRKQYLDRILRACLKEGGKLPVAEYGLSSRPPNTSYMGNLLRAWDYDFADEKSG